jgi:membrane-associated phospholipid phosphatase
MTDQVEPGAMPDSLQPKALLERPQLVVAGYRVLNRGGHGNSQFNPSNARPRLSRSAVLLRLTHRDRMRPWNLAALVFFGYLLLLTPLVPGLRPLARWRAIAGVAAGLALCLLAYATDGSIVVREWLMPPVLLLVGYWTSGQFFAAPMTGIERALTVFDRSFGVDAAIRATPRWLQTVLEAAYAGVYLLVPAALLIRFATLADGQPDEFWTVVLVTDFICFGCLPWIQTRPPRAIVVRAPWRSGVRSLNEQLLAKTSIQHNTFPSGHAAEALACLLLVAAAPGPIVAAVAVAALLVSTGAVLGRYHYAADALAGWIVAAVVWVALT